MIFASQGALKYPHQVSMFTFGIEKLETEMSKVMKRSGKNFKLRFIIENPQVINSISTHST